MLCLLITGLITMLAAVTGAGPASADTPSSGGDVSVAQSLGDRQLTVVLRRVTGVPGPLRVDVITHTGTTPGHLTLTVTPTGASTSASLPAPGTATATAGVDLGPAAGTYSTTVMVDRAGPWELGLGDGVRVARIPFVVAVQATAPPEAAVYGGFVGAGVLLLVSVVVAARARRAAWVLLPAGGLVAAVAVGVTGAVLSASLPLPPQPGNQLDPTVDNVTHPYALSHPLVTDYSRPPVLLSLTGAPLTAGAAGDVDLNLTDGATGVPVDDLLVHDSALIHLLLVGPTGRLWHLHPIRTAPGRYQQHLTLPHPGHYALSAELVRRGGGVQLVRSVTGLDVTGTGTGTGGAAAVALDRAHLTGSTVVDATPVTLTATGTVAGAPTTITAHVCDTADLQPWLGMVGHMIVAGPLPSTSTAVGTAVQDAPIWTHSHSMGAMSMDSMAGGGMGAMTGMAPVNGDSAPDESVAGYGPDVPFTFTFPTVGRYRVWVQAERGFTVLTVPVVIDVAAPATGQGIQ